MANTIPKINFNTIEFLTINTEVIEAVKLFVSQWNDSGDEIIAKSSGSTGVSKEITLEKKHMIASAKMTGKYFNFEKDEKIVLSLSTATIGGKMQVIRALIFGMNLIVTDISRNPLKKLEYPSKFISLVPLQLAEILKGNKEKLLLFDSVLIGGAALHASLEAQLSAINTNFYESYAMTETLSHVAIRKISDKNDVFTAFDQIHFSAIDSCLVIHAPNIGVENLQTNDVVEFISSTEFRLLGRKDYVINSGGLKFHPELMEKKLDGFLSESFFFIGEINQEYGQIVTFYIESTYTLEKIEMLKSLFIEVFDKFERAKKIYFVENFEKTESGKINRLKTQELNLKAQI